MPTAMPTSTSNPKQRYYPDLKDQVPYHAETEFRQLRSMIYDLLDSRIRTLDYTLSAPKRIDIELVAGKSYMVIIRQDATGGWAVDWAANPDGSLKFKGIAVVPPDTTANTYSAFNFIATSTTEALLVGLTGGNLS